jgi:ACS family D-galactonate transporter-like MFS transporter
MVLATPVDLQGIVFACAPAPDYDDVRRMTDSCIPAPPTNVRWRIVALLALFALLCHFNRVSMSVAGTEFFLPGHPERETRVGMIYSAYLLVYTLFMTPGGWLIDRRGPRAALILMGLGSALFVLGTGLVGMVAKTWTLLFGAMLVIRGLLGAVTAPIHPSAARMVQSWTPPAERSLGNGAVNCAALVGIAAAYPVFGWLSGRFGWPGAFVIAGIATVLSASIWMLYARDGPDQHPGVNPEERELIGQDLQISASGATAVGLGKLLRNRSLLLLTLSYATVGYFQYLFFYWMQYYFDHVMDLGKTQSRLYSTLAMVAMAIGMAVGGWLFDRVERAAGQRRGRAGVCIASMSASAFFLGLGLLGQQPGWVVACFTLAMGAIGTCEAAFWTTATQVGAEQGGMAAALMNTGGNAGGLLAPVVTPLFSRHFGWHGGLALACGVALAGAAMWLWIDPATGE